MVKKHDGSWRMCVDFTDLNKACQQVSEIDWKIEFLCDYPFKCFMDAYKGYHQIQMAEEDEEKTAFHTPRGYIASTITLNMAKDCSIPISAGLILTSPEGTEFTYALRFQFTASNNEAKYEALIAGLRIAAQWKDAHLVLVFLFFLSSYK
ncbi:reverse transcriptase domain-containing protein [Tanacetum coccineum]